PSRADSSTSIPLIIFSLLTPPPPRPTLFPYTTLFRSLHERQHLEGYRRGIALPLRLHRLVRMAPEAQLELDAIDGPVHIAARSRSEEHTSELQSRENLVCRLLLEKKKIKQHTMTLS